MAIFTDRRHAGRVLARALARYAGCDDLMVLALPRGGVPVGCEVAAYLVAPLDVFVVRKLGVPLHQELAMGAIASGGAIVLNHAVIQEASIPESTLERTIREETAELERRERAYRGVRPPLDVVKRTVILVDDGLATGATMRAAISGLRELQPARIVVAVPVASSSTCEAVGAEVDDIICAVTPREFSSVGAWYDDFTQTTDQEVHATLAARWNTAGGDRRRESRRHEGDAVLARAIADSAIPVAGSAADYAPLLELASGARLVLIGEATHGTHEFYRFRAELTKRLIVEQGFNGVAAEADWPDAYRVNRYVRALGDDANAQSALSDFKRFPAWMWRNSDVLDFVGWLRAHNDAREAAAKVGFYGLDLYSLYASIEQVLEYLERAEPEAAQRARDRYSCFEQFEEDPQAYGYAASFELSKSCEEEVIRQLVELTTLREQLLRDGLAAEDERFYAEQNARVVRSAERYYRAMFRGRASSWNLRDTHMADTLDALSLQLEKQSGAPPKVVVWAHNSHVGDARATQMREMGELSLGQLARERHGADVVLIGFSTFAGTVTAAADWGARAERQRVRSALPGSYEALFHDTGVPDFVLPLRAPGEAMSALREARLQRAIGVVYRPDSERVSHYLRATLPSQFDAIVHFDRTRALEPLERSAEWEAGQLRDTFPAGL